MALSNWDTLAVGIDGEPCMGWMDSPLGVRVEIYKNWLYVRDPAGWQKESGFTNDMVMQIECGTLTYKDVKIEAIRGPQNGVYVVAYSPRYPEGDERGIPCALIGCGVYGYDGEDWVGVTTESAAFLQAMIRKDYGSSREEAEEWVATLLSPDEDVTVERRESLVALSMERHLHFPDPIAAIKLDCAKRYNQGEAYFAENLGIGMSVTEPGASAEPVIRAMIGDANGGEP